MSYLGTKPANSPLTSELIPDGLIGTSDLANNAVTSDKILANAVTSDKIVTNAVTSDKILANAVTEAKLASSLYTAKAWVNFNGTGTVAIRASGNVSSISDLGTGLYDINFSTSFSDANYAAAQIAQFTEGYGYAESVSLTTSANPATSSCRIRVAVPTLGPHDSAFVNMIFFR